MASRSVLVESDGSVTLANGQRGRHNPPPRQGGGKSSVASAHPLRSNPMLTVESSILLATVVAAVLAAFAQIVVRLTQRQTKRCVAPLSGFAAARRLLDDSGLEDVQIEQVPGTMSDHYEPQSRVLRLSEAVYHGRSLASVGVAAQEVGHAFQHAAGDFRVRLLGIAGMAASFGSGAGISLMFLGIVFGPLFWLGACFYSAAVFLQLVNLPTEINAGQRAKQRLRELEMIPVADQGTLGHVIDAASLNYLAVTLQTVVASVIGILRYMGRRP